VSANANRADCSWQGWDGTRIHAAGRSEAAIRRGVPQVSSRVPDAGGGAVATMFGPWQDPRVQVAAQPSRNGSLVPPQAQTSLAAALATRAQMPVAAAADAAVKFAAHDVDEFVLEQGMEHTVLVGLGFSVGNALRIADSFKQGDKTLLGASISISAAHPPSPYPKHSGALAARAKSYIFPLHWLRSHVLVSCGKGF